MWCCVTAMILNPGASVSKRILKSEKEGIACLPGVKWANYVVLNIARQ